MTSDGDTLALLERALDQTAAMFAMHRENEIGPLEPGKLAAVL